MAVILHIETSTRVCSVGLSREGEWLAVREDRSQNYSHSALLTVFMEEVMKEAAVTADGIDAVAVSRGPGSYTGLRIGVSAAKGFCYALDIPLIAVDTMKALAAVTAASLPSGPASVSGKPKVTAADIPVQPDEPNTGGSSDILYCPMIDARRMEVYYALFTPGLKEVKPTAAEVITEKTFREVLEHHQVIFCGDGAEKCRQVIDNPTAVFIPDSLPTVKGMLPLAEDQFNREDFVDVAYFEPYYLKDFVAGKPKVKGLYS